MDDIEKKYGNKQEWFDVFCKVVKEYFKGQKDAYLRLINYYLLKADEKKMIFLEDAIDMCNHTSDAESDALKKIFSSVKDILNEDEKRDLVELIRKKFPG